MDRQGYGYTSVRRARRLAVWRGGGWLEQPIYVFVIEDGWRASNISDPQERKEPWLVATPHSLHTDTLPRATRHSRV